MSVKKSGSGLRTGGLRTGGLKTGGLKTGGLRTGGLRTGRVGDRRALPSGVAKPDLQMGGGGVVVMWGISRGRTIAETERVTFDEFAQALDIHPWKGTYNSDEGKIVLKAKNELYHSLQSVTDKANDITGYSSADGASISISKGQYLWLEVTLDASIAITATELVTDDATPGTDADFYDLDKTGTYFVKTCWIPILQVTNETPARVIQYVRSHIRLGMTIANGYSMFVHYGQ